MTLVGEFDIPRDRFVLTDTLTSFPDLRLKLLRVAATSMAVSPLIMLAPAGPAVTVDEAIRDDSSLTAVRHLATFDTGALYRGEWDERAEAEARTFTTARSDILGAFAGPSGWRLTAQFADRDAFDDFLGHLREDDISFSLHRLGEANFPPTSIQHGLTPKQYEALLTAWQMGYYERPRAVSLDEVADELDISQQALSQRLVYALDTLIEETIGVGPSP